MMLTLGKLLENIERRFGPPTFRFRFPTTEVIVQDDCFAGLDSRSRDARLAEETGLDLDAIIATAQRGYLKLRLLDRAEPLPSSIDRGYYWLRTLLETPPAAASNPDRVHTVHFYGYKGGQARSSVLATLAGFLANQGWRVLCVDMDAEAPSLDLLLRVRPSTAAETMVGVRAGLQGQPIRAMTSTRGEGWVDLLAFRLPTPNFDLDAAALAMELAMAPPAAAGLIEQVRALATGYDILFIDHRTGIAASVPPWIHSLPGPVLAFARMDGQWRVGADHLRALWSLSPQAPGAVVSFKPDDEPDTDFLLRVMPQFRDLLDRLAEAQNTRLEEDADPITGDDLRDHWVLWAYDPAFREGAAPDPTRLTRGVRDALQKLTRLLGLDSPPTRRSPNRVLHPSGAFDEGDLILTDALRKLRAPNSPFWFVLGRKGTGKTRLVKELAADGLGEPLIVAEKTAANQGLPASHPTLIRLEESARAANDPSALWWELLGAALQAGSTHIDRLVPILEQRLSKPTQGDRIQRVLDLARAGQAPRVFLVDGLETSFKPRNTHDFVGALYQVWTSLDSDERLRSRLRVRIFVRTDLAQRGFANTEQLLHDRRLDLSWDTQTIFNFALSRIAARPWYQEHFPSVTGDLDARRADIMQGALPIEECQDLLLRVFPARLRRQNMLTTTFLRTWFSDDPTGESGYFPRIFDTFLSEVGAAESKGFRLPLEADPTHGELRVSNALVFHAHELATADFLGQIRQELLNLVELDSGQVARLIGSFKGRVTPFDLDQTVRTLAQGTNLPSDQVKDALYQMKSLNIFEEREGYPGQWRAGRLFKTSLGMLYNRRRADR